MDIIVNHDYSANFVKLLVGRGVSKLYFMRNRDKIQLKSCLLPIDSKIDHLNVRSFNQDKQLKAYNTVINSLHKPIRLCISSIPSDLVAKQVALSIMAKATIKHPDIVNKRQGVLVDKPLWVNVYGGFSNQVMNLEPLPSLLVLSNINVNSSASKLEKVRDILEKYDTIPIIIVIGGTDPLTFFSTKLFYPISHCLYLSRSTKEVYL